MTQAQEREIWQPDRHEQLAAVEVLLASPIPYEVRLVIRELEQTLSRQSIEREPDLEQAA